MRLIDADALIDKYGEWYTEEGTEVGYIGTIKGIVDSMPTIESERKTGKWINRWAQNGEQVKEVRECSECGAFYLRYYDTADGFDCVPPRYCPNCGCKMEVEK